MRIDLKDKSEHSDAMWVAIAILFALLTTYLWLQRKVTIRVVREIFNSMEDGHSLIIEDTKLLPKELSLTDFQKILEENTGT